ncbi:CaiB/BaiF CoA transferase family protein [Quadrisphaera setariae]|uniref:CoA transferase n=1 Tax=Quadrisphaera setariae TaxID=2593304 RepID=A0A5C8ZD51_9ACTN|nr:CoA transferase [Quadrisphaera setariae]TXR55093.1 CoA transferase [Quadrisphaera setariae]
MDDQLPLADLLVADFSRVLAGPLATMHLADLGARVIKVERPGAGDETRRWGPPFGATGATYFESVNRNKESVCLDLATEGDRALARELALRADVLVQNFRPGAMEAMGLGLADLRRANPRLVTVSISGFGEAGGAELPGYDFVVQALGGLMHITGEAGGEPQKAGVAVVDVLCGKDAALGVLAALVRRGVTGRGGHVEVNLLSSLQTALVNQVQAVVGAGVEPTRAGSHHPSIAPYELLACADGQLAVACGTDGMFRRLGGELGLPALADDPRFATNSDRVAHRPELRRVLEERLAAAPAREWEERLLAVGVPAGRVASIGQGLRLAESLGLEPLLDVVDGTGRTVGRQVRSPITITPSPPAPRRAPPALGEHEDPLRTWLSAPRATVPAPSSEES